MRNLIKHWYKHWPVFFMGSEGIITTNTNIQILLKWLTHRRSWTTLHTYIQDLWSVFLKAKSESPICVHGRRWLFVASHTSERNGCRRPGPRDTRRGEGMSAFSGQTSHFLLQHSATRRYSLCQITFICFSPALSLALPKGPLWRWINLWGCVCVCVSE